MMKNILLYVIINVILVHSGVNNHQFFPNLPVGEYRVFSKSILKCNNVVHRDELIQYNFYLSKTSSTTTEIKGNMTYKIPIDDTFSIHVNMAVKDSIGGWKENAHVFKAPKACTLIKNSLGPLWGMFFKSFGINKMDCPVKPGVYVMLKGFDLSSNLSNTYIPKRFFYGTYKLRTHFTDSQNTIHGCCIVVVEIKRPWESE